MIIVTGVTKCVVTCKRKEILQVCSRRKGTDLPAASSSKTCCERTDKTQIEPQAISPYKEQLC